MNHGDEIQDRVVLDKAKVAVFDDEERANRTARWLRRSRLHVWVEQEGRTFQVVVPSGPEEGQAHRVLQALEHTRERLEPRDLSGWGWVRGRLLNLEVAGVVVAAACGLVLLAASALWLQELSSAIGWLAVILMVVAGLVYFHFSGLPHSAVKAPRRYSHKHDITMDAEQQVQYRLAWAREQYRSSRRWTFRRKRPKN